MRFIFFETLIHYFSIDEAEKFNIVKNVDATIAFDATLNMLAQTKKRICKGELACADI